MHWTWVNWESNSVTRRHYKGIVKNFPESFQNDTVSGKFLFWWRFLQFAQIQAESPAPRSDCLPYHQRPKKKDRLTQTFDLSEPIYDIFINVQHYSGFPVDYFLWYILVGVSLPYWPVITKIEEFFQQPTSLNELCLYYPVFCLKGNSGAFAWWSTSARWWCWATWMWIINRFQIQNINTSKGSGFGNLDGKQDCFSMLKNDVAFWKLQKISNFQDQICWSKATIVCGRHHISVSRNGSVRELRLPQIVHFMGILDNPWPLKFLEIAGFQQTQPKFLSFRIFPTCQVYAMHPGTPFLVPRPIILFGETDMQRPWFLGHPWCWNHGWHLTCHNAFSRTGLFDFPDRCIHISYISHLFSQRKDRSWCAVGFTYGLFIFLTAHQGDAHLASESTGSGNCQATFHRCRCQVQANAAIRKGGEQIHAIS